MRVGLLADAFGLECTPHNWGNTLDLARALPSGAGAAECVLVRSAVSAELADHPYYQLQVPADKDGYIHAPTEPGLGYPHRPRLRWKNDEANRPLGTLEDGAEADAAVSLSLLLRAAGICFRHTRSSGRRSRSRSSSSRRT